MCLYITDYERHFSNLTPISEGGWVGRRGERASDILVTDCKNASKESTANTL